MKSLPIYEGQTPAEEAKAIRLTPKVEKQIEDLLKAKQAIEDTLYVLGQGFMVEMEKTNTTLIEASSGKFKVARKETGRRFALDPSNSVDVKYTKTVSYPTVNVEQVSAYLITKGKLPKGILENAKNIKISIEPVEGGE